MILNNIFFLCWSQFWNCIICNLCIWFLFRILVSLLVFISILFYDLSNFIFHIILNFIHLFIKSFSSSCSIRSRILGFLFLLFFSFLSFFFFLWVLFFFFSINSNSCFCHIMSYWSRSIWWFTSTSWSWDIFYWFWLLFWRFRFLWWWWRRIFFLRRCWRCRDFNLWWRSLYNHGLWCFSDILLIKNDMNLIWHQRSISIFNNFLNNYFSLILRNRYLFSILMLLWFFFKCSKGNKIESAPYNIA